LSPSDAAELAETLRSSPELRQRFGQVAAELLAWTTNCRGCDLHVRVLEQPDQGPPTECGYGAAVQANQREAIMVSYDFTCTKCGTEFEVSCHMDERKAKAVCPKCGSKKVEQKMRAASSSPRPARY
jgi:putative FmdB family regulatory protein